MTTIDMPGFGVLPNPLVLLSFLTEISNRAQRGEEYKVWMTLEGEKPGKALSARATELLVALVQAGGLHCLHNEEKLERPKGAFGQISTCVGLGLVYPEADGSIDMKYMDKLLEKYRPVVVLGVPMFIVQPPRLGEAAVNAPPPTPSPWMGGATTPLGRLRVVREDVN